MSFTPRVAEKRWDPKMEETLLSDWGREKVGRFNPSSGKPIFTVDTPPPYASGRWHVGGATHYAQIDMVARYFKMRSFEVLFPFGLDRNGLPVEVEVEKKHKVSAHQIGREKFLELCRGFLDEVEGAILSTARRLGMSCNFDTPYRTDSPEYRRLTQDTFLTLWGRGLIYEENRPTNWCSVCGTSIADAEIEYEDWETKLYHIRFPLKGGGDAVIATTRPELLPSCAIIIHNPEDERYRELSGKVATTPLFGIEVPVVANNYAKPEFGTGLAMICSFGDYTDIRLFRELSLEAKISIDAHGRMNENAGPYKGLKVVEARRRIVEDLGAGGFLVKEEPLKQNRPICWRSKNPVEFIAMKEYYLKQLPHLQALKEMAGEIRFHPEEARGLLLNWINSVVSDWPISRRRFYGTEIPLWYCARCAKPHLPPPGRYYQPWRERPPFDRCEECGSSEFLGETRTFDTWMDSSVSQLFIMGFGRDKELFEKAFPCSLRPQGTDIVRTWLYYSLLRTYQLTSAQAFNHVRISGMGLDERGEAMHKSKGNVTWPEPILQRYGADTFRFWGASEAKLGSNYRFSQQRLEGSARFLTKLWNIGRYISSFPQPEGGWELAPLDRMILAGANSLIEECSRGYEDMDVFTPAQALRGFLWNLFADHYLEASKPRAYNLRGAFTEAEQRGAWHTLHAVLERSLRLLAPLCPFITDALWRRVYGERSIHLEDFPQPDPAWSSPLKEAIPKFTEFNSALWKYKKSRGMTLNEGLEEVYAPTELEPFSPDLKEMHRIVNLYFKEPPEEARGGMETVGDVHLKP